MGRESLHAVLLDFDVPLSPALPRGVSSRWNGIYAIVAAAVYDRVFTMCLTTAPVFRTLISQLNDPVVCVAGRMTPEIARIGAGNRPAARLVCSVLMDDPGCLMAVPDPQIVKAQPCKSPKTRFLADHCGSRGVPLKAVAHDLFGFWRDRRCPFPGRVPVNPCDTSCHGLLWRLPAGPFVRSR